VSPSKTLLLQPEESSREGQLMKVLREPRDWLRIDEAQVSNGAKAKASESR